MNTLMFIVRRDSGKTPDYGWSPWNMDRATLAALPSKQPLSDDDRARICGLRARSKPEFADLLDAFDALGVKGEQEGWR